MYWTSLLCTVSFNSDSFVQKLTSCYSYRWSRTQLTFSIDLIVDLSGKQRVLCTGPVLFITQSDNESSSHCTFPSHLVSDSNQWPVTIWVKMSTTHYSTAQTLATTEQHRKSVLWSSPCTAPPSEASITVAQCDSYTCLYIVYGENTKIRKFYSSE